MKHTFIAIAATLLLGCAGQRASGLEGRQTREVTARLQIKVPADPYTPTAQAMPLLHEMAFRICGREYRVVDRRIGRSFETGRVYDARVGATVPTLSHGHAVIATVECLERGPVVPATMVAGATAPSSRR